jgi:hypothetical protein
METPDITDIGFINEKIQQQMIQISDDIAYLLGLANDPQKYGELIKAIDPTMDKVNQHAITMQNRLIKERDRKVQEFKTSIKALDNPLTMAKSKPPGILSNTDAAKWKKLAVSEASPQELADFKDKLINTLKDEVSQSLQVEKLTQQNMSIRGILDKIRQTLII